jgi:RimJ/RimL family protein N-acetyltransferase
MRFNIQPNLENEKLAISPLEEKDFEALYTVASDPEIWAQHPNKNRWQKEVFQVFFEGALQSKAAFKIIDKETQSIVGSTRFYDYKEEDDSILIGYTFYAKAYWGNGVNLAVKEMMLNYIFQFVTQVFFHVGAENIRSQIAITRLNAVKVDELVVAYFGESPKHNFVYRIEKKDWQLRG